VEVRVTMPTATSFRFIASVSVAAVLAISWHELPSWIFVAILTGGTLLGAVGAFLLQAAMNRPSQPALRRLRRSLLVTCLSAPVLLFLLSVVFDGSPFPATWQFIALALTFPLAAAIALFLKAGSVLESRNRGHVRVDVIRGVAFALFAIGFLLGRDHRVISYGAWALIFVVSVVCALIERRMSRMGHAE
jgi:hypothetical protein